MTEPRRWLDDSRIPGDLRGVLESAGAPPPLPQQLNAQLSEYAASLAAQSLLAKVGGVSLVHKLFLTAGGSSKALLALSLLGGVGVGGYALSSVSAQASHAHNPPAPVSTAKLERSSVAQRAVATSRAPGAIAGEAPSVRVIPARPGPAPALSAAHAAEPAPVAVAKSAGASSIADEAKLLESARSFLDDSPSLALDLTEQHRRLHPVGQLSAERELVAIEALLKLGRRTQAEQRAAPLLGQPPGSLYARRLRQLLTPGPAASSNSNNL